MVLSQLGRGRTARRLGLLRRRRARQLRTAAPSTHTVSGSVTAVPSEAIKAVASAAAAAGAVAASSFNLSDTALRNMALEAVKSGNYWAGPEDQEEVVRYIGEAYGELFEAKWVEKNREKLEFENGLTRRYGVVEILSKVHEADGFNIFVDPEEALAEMAVKEAELAASASAPPIMAGTALVASKKARVFVSVSLWDQVGELPAGQHVEATGAPVLDNGFRMVPILEPKGAVEVRLLHVPGSGIVDHDLAEEEALVGRLGELREGLEVVIAAAEQASNPVGLDELMDLLEGCAAIGELGAAVYLGERFEVQMATSPPGALDRVFAALKPLLRPKAVCVVSHLKGPWSEAASGRAGVPNQRKGLGQVLTRLANARRDQKIAEGGEAAEHKATQDAVSAMFSRVCRALQPLMAADAEIMRCRRRGPMVEALERLSDANGFKASRGLFWVIISEFEKLGVVKGSGRQVEFHSAAPGTSDLTELNACNEDLVALEAAAQERLDRRKKRQKGRQQASAAKRRRTDDE